MCHVLGPSSPDSPKSYTTLGPHHQQSLISLTTHKMKPFLTWDHQFSILWLDVDDPYL